MTVINLSVIRRRWVSSALIWSSWDSEKKPSTEVLPTACRTKCGPFLGAMIASTCSASAVIPRATFLRRNPARHILKCKRVMHTPCLTKLDRYSKWRWRASPFCLNACTSCNPEFFFTEKSFLLVSDGQMVGGRDVREKSGEKCNNSLA